MSEQNTSKDQNIVQITLNREESIPNIQLKPQKYPLQNVPLPNCYHASFPGKQVQKKTIPCIFNGRRTHLFLFYR